MQGAKVVYGREAGTVSGAKKIEKTDDRLDQA
jgi:hypothetical protein